MLTVSVLLCSKLTLHSDCCEAVADDINLGSFLQLLQTHQKKEVGGLLVDVYVIIFKLQYCCCNYHYSF